MSQFEHLRRDRFPADFTFGTATSSYQIEGSSFGGCGRSHWDTFAATPGNTKNGEDGSIACDHYHRWEGDLDLVRDAGLDAYRFSISWARVLPDGTGAPNEDGLDFYDRLVDGMLERGLKAFATLYHWDLPTTLAALGGWQNRDIADWFADYTNLIIRRLGDRLAAVAPINEPWCVAWLSHFDGHHAPGLRDIAATARAMHHVLLAHGRSVEAMRAEGYQQPGTVLNFEYAQPASENEADVAAATRYDAFYNRWFLEGAFAGRYPAEVLEGLGPHMPKNFEDDFPTIGAPVEWVGINYYTRKIIAAEDGPWPSYTEVEGPLEKTSMGWEIYPDGLHHFLTRVGAATGGRLPIFVTENGLSAPDSLENGTVDDEQRRRYLDSHAAQVLRAIDEGVHVDGYFIWSLLDNYEWALGYEKRFGLVHVDFDTLDRTPKASWQALRAAMIRSG